MAQQVCRWTDEDDRAFRECADRQVVHVSPAEGRMLTVAFAFILMAAGVAGALTCIPLSGTHLGFLGVFATGGALLVRVVVVASRWPR